MAFGLQLLFQGQVILDDAVVHHHDVAGAIAVRVGVFLGGAPVRGPARMPDAVRAVDGVQPDGFFQIAQFARCAAHGELAVIAIDRDAGHNGSHPPRNNVVVMAHTVIMFEYSAMKNAANFMLLYSV